HAQVGPAGLGQLVGQKDGQAAVGAHEQDLLHGPHGLGVALSGHLVGVAADVDVLVHHTLEGAGADAVGLHRLFRVDVDVEGDGVQHAGGRQDAHIPRKQPVQGDVPAVLAQQVGP